MKRAHTLCCYKTLNFMNLLKRPHTVYCICYHLLILIIISAHIDRLWPEYGHTLLATQPNNVFFFLSLSVWFDGLGVTKKRWWYFKTMCYTLLWLTCVMWKGVKQTVKMISTVHSSWTALLLLSLRKYRQSTTVTPHQPPVLSWCKCVLLLVWYVLASKAFFKLYIFFQ